jgi:hypothetical protein
MAPPESTSPAMNSELLAILRRLGLGGGQVVRAMSPLTGGVSSDIWRIDFEDHSICVQALAIRQLDPDNAPVFDKHNRPHNPMVNAGAMMISTLLVNEGKTIEDLMDFYMRASSSTRADIDLPLYKEEALTGSTNHALRSLMLSRGMYPVKATFEQTKQVWLPAVSVVLEVL